MYCCYTPPPPPCQGAPRPRIRHPPGTGGSTGHRHGRRGLRVRWKRQAGALPGGSLLRAREDGRSVRQRQLGGAPRNPLGMPGSVQPSLQPSSMTRTRLCWIVSLLRVGVGFPGCLDHRAGGGEASSRVLGGPNSAGRSRNQRDTYQYVASHSPTWGALL